MEPDKIIQRYSVLKHDRTLVEDLWQLLERFVRPLSGRFLMTKEHDGTVNWRRREIYDGMAINAATALAASLQGNLVSPSVKWFDLRFGRSVTNDKDEAREWLDEASEAIFYELQQSNFNQEIGMAFDDLVTFGTSAVVEEVDNETGDLDFTAVPLREVYFEPNYRGGVKTFYRQLELTPVQIVDRWGKTEEERAKLPTCVLERYDSDDINEMNRFEVVFCIFERDPSVWLAVDRTQESDVKSRRYGYRYVLFETREELGEEGGYYEMPAFLTRWRTTAGSRWGHAPGLYCMSTIMSLNQAYELTLESALKQIEPPIMTTQRGLLSDMEMFAGGVNVVGDMNDLAPFPVGGDINSGIVIIEDLRMQIRRAFYEDQLELKESPAMTATEVQVRYELMQRLLGPTLGRLQSDLLDPLIQRTFFILLRQGKIPMPVGIVEQGDDIEVEYVGPLPRAQKADKAAAMLGLYAQLAALAEVNPELMDVVDDTKLFTEVAELTGVPADVIRSQDEIAQIRRQRQEAMARAAQLEEKRMQGEAMKSMGEGTAAVTALPPEGIQAVQGAVPPRRIR